MNARRMVASDREAFERAVYRSVYAARAVSDAEMSASETFDVVVERDYCIGVFDGDTMLAFGSVRPSREVSVWVADDSRASGAARAFFAELERSVRGRFWGEIEVDNRAMIRLVFGLGHTCESVIGGWSYWRFGKDV